MLTATAFGPNLYPEHHSLLLPPMVSNVEHTLPSLSDDMLLLTTTTPRESLKTDWNLQWGKTVDQNRKAVIAAKLGLLIS